MDNCRTHLHPQASNSSFRIILTTCLCAIITGSAIDTLINEVGARFSDIEFCVNKTAMVNAQNFFFYILFSKAFFYGQHTIHIANTNYQHCTHNRILYIQSNGGRAEWGEPNVEKVILPQEY